MSVTADDEAGSIEAAYDDPENPSELTLFSTESEGIGTCWLTIDIEHAVDLSEWI